jgi:hypothetical protein
MWLAVGLRIFETARNFSEVTVTGAIGADSSGWLYARVLESTQKLGASVIVRKVLKKVKGR